MKRCSHVAAVCLFAVLGFSQTPTASVVGRVTDPTGAVIPGVALKITNLDTNIAQTGSTNEVGDFTVPYLNPGRYLLEASATGFRSYKRARDCPCR